MKKTQIITALLLTLAISSVHAQLNRFDPDSILVGNRKLPSVLLVGSFHFAYFNFDAYKTAKENQVDILSVQKQKELEELLQYIYRFKPTKIAVESGSITGYLVKRYHAYLKGERPLAKDETEQIGFRTMKQFSLDTIYGVNAGTLVYDLEQLKDSNTIRPIMDSIYKDWDFKSDDSITQRYRSLYRYHDELAIKMPLLDYFRHLNSDKELSRGFGAYLNGDFKLGGTRGADALAMHWYARNLRIYRHIQDIVTSPDDRILVIFGAGHIQILKTLFESSPEFKLVKFDSLQ